MKLGLLRAILARSDQAGAFAAVGSISGTFQRTLMPRSNRDQAIVTGMSMSLFYLMASLVQDGIESVSSWVLMAGKREASEDEDAQRRVSLALGTAALLMGLELQVALPQQKDEPLRRSALRTTAFWLSAGAFSGLAASVGQEFLGALDRRGDHDRGLRNLPVGMFNGLIFAAVREVQFRRQQAIDAGDTSLEELDISAPRALAMGGAIWAGLVATSQLNRAFTRIAGRALDRYLPADERLWRPLAHVGWLGLICGALYLQLQKINRSIEEGVGKIEGSFETPPSNDLVSGSSNSLVAWETLSREGRRHVSTSLSREKIEEVMHEPAMDPIRVYVGLDSADTEEERVTLAVREMERTGAFERKLIIATSPTGTGYVNYVAIESAEYLSRGNCATVTLQYSKRPSPLSLDRVWEGRKHFRMLLAAIRRRLYLMAPEQRPRLVVFGESLGAHTSQDAFLHSGTQGLQDAGVERALWIGTPHLSKWAVQTLARNRMDVEPDAIGEFNDFGEVKLLSDEARSKLRYVLITHGNDGVSRFGPDLLIQQPAWLGDPDTRPRGVPKAQKWVTFTTFVQTLFDMNNAMNVVPGEFVARGHDYRADLARFVLEAYGLNATDEQLERIEATLRRNETERALRIASAQVAAESEVSTDAETDVAARS